jgi:hypothetical protein
MRKSALAVAAVFLACGAAQAQTERFQIERTDGGVVRLDKQTGAMTLCREESGNLVCHMAPDERAAYDDELDRLAKRVTALEERIDSAPRKMLPSEDEVEQSLSIMERVLRRFMGIINEFTMDRDAGEPQPNRT